MTPAGSILRACLSLALALTALTASLWATPARAVTCKSIRFEDNRYSICEVDATQENLRLFLNDDEGQPIANFQRLETLLAETGETLEFAMNAGMYHEDRSPVGFYVQDGKEEMRVISSAGPGNFGLLPNGLLCITDTSARVYETRDYLAAKPACRDATQSGPMLVINNKLHPRFLRDSTSRYIRNGVGTSKDGKKAIFAISTNTVTFWEFARLFRDGLKLPNALFLDGNISRLYAPELGRNDFGRRMGPIVAVTAP